MRVLMLSWEYPPNVVGGLARHTYHLANALAGAGTAVSVLTVGSTASAGSETPPSRVQVHRVPVQNWAAPDFVSQVLQLNLAFLEEGVRRVEEDEPYDLIHAHDWLVAPAAMGLKRLFRLPLVATIHAAEHGRHGGLYTPEQHYISQIEWELTYEAWRVILCSHFMKRDLHSCFGLPLGKMVVIPNGVRLGSGRDHLPLTRRKPLILFVGRLVREKGVEVLLRAMPQVLEACPDAWCVVAGTGPCHGELRELSDRLGVGDRVLFMGYVDDPTLTNLYRSARVAVFPSLYEPFGIVVLEAMAGGAATVVSDVGGLGEIVEQGVTGRKCLPGDPQALSGEIISLLNHPERGQELVDGAYQRLTTDFSWTRVADQTLEVYQEVIQEQAAGNWKHPPMRRSWQRARAWTRRLVGPQERRGAGT